MADNEAHLLSIGMKPAEVTKTLKNSKQTSRLLSAIEAAKIPAGGCPPAKGTLILKLSQKEIPNSNVIAQYIGEDKIATPEQLDGAIEYCTKNDNLDTTAFEAAAGIGIEVTTDEIKAAVAAAVSSLADIVTTKGKKAMGDVMNAAKSANPKMKFASRATLSAEVTAALSTVEVKPAESTKEAKKPEKKADAKKEAKKEVKKEAKDENNEEEENGELVFQGIVARFPTPADNALKNPADVQEEHMKVTGGEYRTRFPPEPNGWIHIGHAKAMLLDFGLAQLKGGKCYMRFDDTNPTKEKDEFIEGIKKDVQWMGFQWWKITHTSDYFQELYDFAVRLIKEGKAYVCHQTKDEVKASREKREPSPWRDRPVEESLREFEMMRTGCYAPSEATLRLKMDITSLNPNMYDQVAYRIKYDPHPRTHDKWCIYPTYDYSHCVIDSLEEVTHSLCTLEFENREDSYYWVLDALRIYKPYVWEFSRLNLTNTVMSKRRLQTLVYDHHVSGWDDPRMPTVAGLRRRGFTASAIRKFVFGVGFTRNVTTMIDYGRLENVQRTELDEKDPRAFCVLEPLKITIRNMGEKIEVEAPLFPKRPADGSRKMVLAQTAYIEAGDFSEEPPKGFKRLTMQQPVGLKYANVVVKCVEVKKEAGKIVELICEKVDGVKAAAYIHWASERAKEVEVRLYDVLFNEKDVMAYTGNWLDILNKDSLKIMKSALVEPSVCGAKVYDSFQFERLGFFVIDEDSTNEHMIINRTLTLRGTA